MSNTKAKSQQKNNQLSQSTNIDANFDWQFLLQNVVTPQNLIEFSDAMRLFPNNASCHEFNKKKLMELAKPITKLNAVNRPTRAKNYSDENFYGLSNYKS